MHQNVKQTHWVIFKHDHSHAQKCQATSSFIFKVHPGFWHALFHQEGTTLHSPTSMTQKFVELIRSAACTASQVPILMWQGGMQVCVLVQRQVRAACPARAGTSQWPPTHSAINYSLSFCKGSSQNIVWWIPIPTRSTKQEQWIKCSSVQGRT